MEAANKGAKEGYVTEEELALVTVTDDIDSMRRLKL